jgi:hypothetical protein
MNAVEFLEKEMENIGAPCSMHKGLMGDAAVLYINAKYDGHSGDVQVRITDCKCVINWSNSWNETVLSSLNHIEMLKIAIPILGRFEKVFPIHTCEPKPVEWESLHMTEELESKAEYLGISPTTLKVAREYNTLKKYVFPDEAFMPDDEEKL